MVNACGRQKTNRKVSWKRFTGLGALATVAHWQAQDRERDSYRCCRLEQSNNLMLLCLL